LSIESRQGLKGEDVVMTLNRIKIQRGIPTMLYCDNGSELKLKTIFEDEWVIVPRCSVPLVALEDSTMR